MTSKGHLHTKKILESFCKIHRLELLKEVKEGSCRYDFYIPTSTPIVIEFNGSQHNLEKADGFFFKNTEALLQYKKNDSYRKTLHRIGKIILLEIQQDEFIDLDWLEEKLKDYQQMIEEGNDEDNAYYKRIRNDRERKREVQRKTSQLRKEFKEKYSLRNRFK